MPWLIIGLFVGFLLGIVFMSLLVTASAVDKEMRGGISLETKGSHETNPFQEQEADGRPWINANGEVDMIAYFELQMKQAAEMLGNHLRQEK